MRGRQALLDAASSYLRRHPEELARFLRNAVGLRLGVPIAALEWLARESRGPRDITLAAVPPGLSVGATLQLMGTTVRAETEIYVERVLLAREILRIELRLERTRMAVLDESQTHVAALIRSGALDLAKAGSLAAQLPEVRPLLGESQDNRVVIDLGRHPRIGGNPVVRRALGLATSFLTVRGIATDPGHLDVSFHAFPEGVGAALRAVRRHFAAGEAPRAARGMLRE
jgi:hypothetical protein